MKNIPEWVTFKEERKFAEIGDKHLLAKNEPPHKRRFFQSVAYSLFVFPKTKPIIKGSTK